MTSSIRRLPGDTAPVDAWPAVRIAAAVSVVLWLFMALAGASAIEGIGDQHVPGYPNDGQLRLYVVIPLIGLVGSAAVVCFARRLPSLAKRIAVGLRFFALLSVFLVFGGGV